MNDAVDFYKITFCRENLIDSNIERKVSRMQSVIEIGRVIRDRKTIPTKYPLPEVVIIHKDQEYLNDIRELEQYVIEVRWYKSYAKTVSLN